MEGRRVSHLLDTNAWKWLAAGGRLKSSARFLAQPDHPLYLLDISFLEICKSVEYGTLELTLPALDWIRAALKKNITVLTITPEVADQSCRLSDLGLKTEDPADQMIVAAALVNRLTLVTRDKKIIAWGGVNVIEY